MNYLDVVAAFTLGVSIPYLGGPDSPRTGAALFLSVLSMLYLVTRL